MTANEWRPSPKMLLTIKQMGIPSHFVEQAVKLFCDEVSNVSNQAFLRWVYSRFKTQHGEDTDLVKQSHIPLLWQPDSNDIRALQEEGYLKALVENKVALFVMAMRGKKRVTPSWSASFRCYIRRALHPIAPCVSYDAWCLNRSVRQYLLSPLGFDGCGINTALDFFKLLAKARSYPIKELDERFIKFIREWNG